MTTGAGDVGAAGAETAAAGSRIWELTEADGDAGSRICDAVCSWILLYDARLLGLWNIGSIGSIHAQFYQCSTDQY